MIRAARAIYKKGRLTFLDKTVVPKDGTEVIVTFTDDSSDRIPVDEAIKALRGRGKGERLVEKLLESRREDLKKDERYFCKLKQPPRICCLGNLCLDLLEFAQDR